MNHRHIKWVEFLQSYTFTIKHKKGTSNKVANSLRRRILVVHKIRLNNYSIHSIKDMYKEDEDFGEAYKVCNEQSKIYHSEFEEYVLQEGLIFKGS